MKQWPFTQIICFGDSITEGYMVEPSSSYPSRLSQILGIRCINLGVSGDTSSDGIRRIGELESALKETDTSLVLIEFGINDFFSLFPRRQTKANLGRLVEHIRTSGDSAALLGFDMDYPGVREWVTLYSELSSELGVALYPNVFTGLSKGAGDFLSDGLHPSSSGYEKMAKGIGQFIARLFKG